MSSVGIRGRVGRARARVESKPLWLVRAGRGPSGLRRVLASERTFGVAVAAKVLRKVKERLYRRAVGSGGDL